MSTISTSKAKDLNISVKIEGVDQGFYNSLFRTIDEFNQKDDFGGDEDAYKMAKFIISNHVWLVYERLEKKVVRNINYIQVKKWAGENQDFVRFLLAKHFTDFEISAFDKWVQPRAEIQRIGMYSASTRQTKNFYH